MLLYILANLILLFIGLGIVNLLDNNNTLTLVEKYVVGFILGIAVNSFLLFTFGWAQIHMSTVKFVDIGILLILIFFNYRKDIWKRLLSSAFRMPEFTKRDLIVIPFLLLILFKVFFSFFHSTNVPSYFDDEKWNWNIKSKTIYNVGIISTVPTDEAYLGGGGHKGYPLNFILYKVYVADFMGMWNESYINLVTFIIFNLVILLVILSFPNRTLGIIAGYLIYSIPLIVWHSGTAYYDLVYASFYLLSIMFFMRYVEKQDNIFLVLIGILLYSTIFTKNEGMILITPSIFL